MTYCILCLPAQHKTRCALACQWISTILTQFKKAKESWWGKKGFILKYSKHPTNPISEPGSTIDPNKTCTRVHIILETYADSQSEGKTVSKSNLQCVIFSEKIH